MMQIGATEDAKERKHACVQFGRTHFLDVNQAFDQIMNSPRKMPG